MEKSSSIEVSILEIADGMAVLKLPAPGFEELSFDEKMAIYNLWQAAAIGDSITWDQNYRYGLALRDLFLGLAEKEDCPENIKDYAKKLCIHHGNHDGWTTAKFLADFGPEELDSAIGNNSYLAGIRKRLSDRVIFDPGYEVMLTQKNPKSGDIITESHNNFYSGVTLADLDGFKEKYPENSTIIKEDGKIIERPWTIQGLYATQLGKIIYHLKQCQKYCKKDQKESFSILIRYFQQGDPELFDQYNIQWLQTNPMVDTIFGFIESYRDPRSKKALFEALIFFKDRKTQHIIDHISSLCQHFEDNSPWKKEYRKKWSSIPVSNAIIQITGTGGAGPLCWAGVNLPNSQKIREEHGSKSIYVSNVTYASRNAFAKKIVEEFIESKKDREMMLENIEIRSPVMVTLHEIVGHGAGKSSENLNDDPREYLKEHYSAIEEARAELCALHHIFDKEMRSIVSEECAKSAYLGYIMSGMVQLRSIKHEDEIHEDHQRATNLIVNYLIEKGCAGFYKNSGKSYPEVVDYDAMRKHVAGLLCEIQRIKSEGDYEAARDLMDRYGRKFDLELRDEIVERCRQQGIPDWYSYVVPEPKLVKKDEEIVDVMLEYPSGIIEQARRWKEIEEINLS